MCVGVALTVGVIVAVTLPVEVVVAVAVEVALRVAVPVAVSVKQDGHSSQYKLWSGGWLRAGAVL